MASATTARSAGRSDGIVVGGDATLQALAGVNAAL